MNEEENEEFIEQYLSGELAGDRLREIEARLAADAAFRRQVEVQQAVIQQTKKMGRAELRQRLRKLEERISESDGQNPDGESQEEK